ncbi:AmpG family muropeptide MFS transporter [Legionella septentrionalis]|uniref:AmpG family muropeptide MFS transporter n=1 Tax=Legionella septentrionalis TaxID=2498109 RepID=UPI000F8D9125|nr:MFS transporter [Legionella septentrionalis]RUR15474.1 MFS transporter [Legionella septentrionalis]
MNKRLLIVFILGFSSGLPLSLLSSTLQAWFAEVGMSVLATGTLSLLGLPYLYRTIWGPFLDKYSILPMGKRRSWILTTQLLLLFGFNIMAWFSPDSTPMMLGVLAFVLACVGATQDMAIEAHRTEYLPPPEQGLGASVAVLGFRLALLLSGGVALVMAQQLGWASTYRIMGFLMLIGVIATIYSPEPSLDYHAQDMRFGGLAAPIKELMTRKNIIPLLFFIFFYKLAEAFTATTSGIVMPFLIQGIGFSLDWIGYINKICGIGAIVLGGLIAGVLLMRWSLYRALLVFGLLQALTNILFVALAIVGKNLVLFAVAVFFDNFAAGMGSTALVALLMRIVDRRFTATQFSLLASLSALPRIISGPFAAGLQSMFGWIGLYQLSVVFALGFLPFLLLIRDFTNSTEGIKEADTLPELDKI